MVINSYKAEDPTSVNLIEQFLTGATTPRAYLERCIAAIESYEVTVQAFSYLNIEQARALADAATQRYARHTRLSPIDGIPVGIKDVIDTACMPTQMNSPIYKDSTPRGNAACVQAVIDGGGIPFGKTVTTEFAIGGSGPTTNPHNPKHTPGGSSSGSAAGTAAGFFPASFGTQTQGSIIRPASFCGVVGYKPTHHTLSTNGVHPLSTTLDHLGTIAINVDQAWALARWVSERAPAQGSYGLGGPVSASVAPTKMSRVAVLRTAGYDDLCGASSEQFEALLSRLRAENIDVVESANHPHLLEITQLLDAMPSQSLELLAYEMRWPYRGYKAQRAHDLGVRINQLMEDAEAISRDQYQHILAFRSRVQQLVNAQAANFDAFVLPAAAGPAPVGFEYTGARTLLVYSTFLGLPAYSLPLMRVNGMPFGLQVIGFPHSDYRLTQYAQWLMQNIMFNMQTNG